MDLPSNVWVLQVASTTHHNWLDQPQRSMRTCAQAVLSRSTLIFARNRQLRFRNCINHRNNSTKAGARIHLQATRQTATYSNDQTHCLPRILETTTDLLLAPCNASLLVHLVGTSNNGQVRLLLFRHPSHNHTRASTSASPLRKMIATGGSTGLGLPHTPSVAVTLLGHRATTARHQHLLQSGRQQVALLLHLRDLDRDHLLRQAVKFLAGNRLL